jgi:hypothetical protein
VPDCEGCISHVWDEVLITIGEEQVKEVETETASEAEKIIKETENES